MRKKGDISEFERVMVGGGGHDFEGRGQRTLDRLVLATQITTLHESISERTTHPTLKWVGYAEDPQEPPKKLCQWY